MGYYRKKPVVIEAIQLTETNIAEVYQFIHPEDNFSRPVSSIASEKWYEYETVVKREGMYIYTLESGNGTQIASFGDFIIKGIQGEFYPCKPDIFEKTYEIVNEAIL